jgi:hypothetical protein
MAAPPMHGQRPLEWAPPGWSGTMGAVFPTLEEVWFYAVL